MTDISDAAHARRRRTGAYVAGGLGVIAVLVEAVTHGTASVLYDPLPTLWHVPIALAAPGALIAATVLRRRESGNARDLVRAALLAGYAVGVGGAYFIAFLPTIPIMAIAIVFYGLGLFGFSPLAVTLAGVLELKTLASAARMSEPPIGIRRPALAGAVGGIALLALATVRIAITLGAMELTTLSSPALQSSGVAILRQIRDDKTLLTACYKPGPTHLWTGEARKLWYRVTGVAFDAVPRPDFSSFFGAGMQWSRDFSEDWRGDWWAAERPPIPHSGARAMGLALAGSALDASVSDDGLVAYVEWTLTFSNSGPIEQEAEALIALPPGAFGSRLTLWVDGEEREAAYATTAHVQSAYEAVAIKQRHDPALLTWAGPEDFACARFRYPTMAA